MKLTPYHYYDRSMFRTWVGYWTDGVGNQIGDCVYAATEEEVLIEMGRYWVELKEKEMKDAADS